MVRMAPQHDRDHEAHGRQECGVAQVGEPAEGDERGPRHVGADGIGQRLVGQAHRVTVGKVRRDPREHARCRKDQQETRREPDGDARLAGFVGIERLEMAPLQRPADGAGAEHRHGPDREKPAQRMGAELLGKENERGGERGSFQRHAAAP
jgi:hypothetical protein